MTGYLQCHHDYRSRLLIGPDETNLVAASERRTRSVPMIGLYATVAGHRTLFYRWNGELRLRWDEGASVGLNDVQADWSQAGGDAIFTLMRGDRSLINARYPLSLDIQRIDVDPTPFVEAEHFDLFLFVANVLRDPARAERIFRTYV